MSLQMIELDIQELKEILNADTIQGSLKGSISGLTSDSRNVKQGFAFFCVKGTKSDGHNYASQAVQAGAKVIVCETEVKIDNSEVTVLKVPNTRKAYALASAAFYGFPSKALKLVGVTGTNGKTTTTFILKKIFEGAGFKSGLIGTVCVKLGEKELPATHTTPDPEELQRILKIMIDEGVSAAAMEVSSHSIDQERIFGTYFDALVFTNLSQDHLDYHQTMEEYERVKLRLFFENPDIPWIVNIDDSTGAKLFKEAAKKRRTVLSYSLKNTGADFFATNTHFVKDGIVFDLYFRGSLMAKTRLPLLGLFNAYNALAATASAYSLGLELKEIIESLPEVEQVPGRFERVAFESDIIAIVDYAHTPDSLHKTILSAIELLKGLDTGGRLITVFGCGGDRDRTKRPAMGRIASELSSIVVVTSDNPRSEEPADIIQDILAGVEEMHKDKAIVEIDRREAIFKAVEIARPGDVVLIAGKGHETYQIFKDRTVHFDDREVALEALKERKRRVVV